MKRILFLLLFLVSASFNTIAQEHIHQRSKNGWLLTTLNRENANELIFIKKSDTKKRDTLKGIPVQTDNKFYIKGNYNYGSDNFCEDRISFTGVFLVSNTRGEGFNIRRFEKKDVTIVPNDIYQIKYVYYSGCTRKLYEYVLNKNIEENRWEFRREWDQPSGYPHPSHWEGHKVEFVKCIPLRLLRAENLFNLTPSDVKTKINSLTDSVAILYTNGRFIGKEVSGEMHSGTFYFKTGEIFIGNMKSSTYMGGINVGIPTDGKWILKDSTIILLSELELSLSSEEIYMIANQTTVSKKFDRLEDILAFRKNIIRLIELGKEAEDKGDYEEAEENYNSAIQGAKKNKMQVEDAVAGLQRVQTILAPKREEERKILEQKRKEERRQRLVNKYGIKWADLIEKKELTIGMPRDAVFEFMPEHVYIPNKITTGSHVTETYRVDMSNAYIWAVSEAKKEGGDAGLRLLYEQAMMIKMFGGNPDIQFEKAIREMLPKLEFKDGKLSSFSSY